MKDLLHTFLIASSLMPLIIYAQPSIQWQKCFGGSKQDLPGSIIPTSDGGYIMAGSTQSTDGDVTSGHGGYDLWVVKMNADGSIKWQKTYGGSHDDGGGQIMEIPGGYLIGGQTQSDDGDLQGITHHGTSATFDIWILEIDTAGFIHSQKTFGGSGDDNFVGLEEAGEGEYLVCATTQSTDGDVKGFHGGTGNDIWVFDFAETGQVRWQKTFGGTKDDNAN